MKILVADSLAGNLSAIKKLLEREGYEVLTTPKGEDVLKLLGTDDEFDLVIIDLDLAGRMQGPELVEKILNLRPKQVWMMTGASWHPAIPDREKFLEKPYTSEDLFKAIKVAINNP